MMAPTELDIAESMNQTNEHKANVQKFINQMVYDILERSLKHDNSKLYDPDERDGFAFYTKKLADLTYGSDEYTTALEEMKPFLDKHYAANRHHPEHHPNGIEGMTVVDLLEMICDWSAATLRHKNGNILKSIDLNQSRFGYGDELKQIMINTVLTLPGLIDSLEPLHPFNNVNAGSIEGNIVFTNEITRHLDSIRLEMSDDTVHFLSVPYINPFGYSARITYMDQQVMTLLYDRNHMLTMLYFTDGHLLKYADGASDSLKIFAGRHMGKFDK